MDRRAGAFGRAPTPTEPSPLPTSTAGKITNAPRPGASAPSPRAAQELSAERALLDGARRALGAGTNDEARQALEDHERRFPSGLLTEEREALTIKLFAATGRRDEARDRKARFRERFPNSLFGPAVDEALGSIP